jgi:hypothetical protein
MARRLQGPELLHLVWTQLPARAWLAPSKSLSSTGFLARDVLAVGAETVVTLEAVLIVGLGQMKRIGIGEGEGKHFGNCR